MKMSKDESIFSFKIFWNYAILTSPVTLSLGNYSQQKDKSPIRNKKDAI